MKDFARISENYPEGFHACLNVTGNEKTRLFLETTVHLEDDRSVLFIVFQCRGIREILRIKTLVSCS